MFLLALLVLAIIFAAQGMLTLMWTFLGIAFIILMLAAMAD
jgi:hypothetical protein